MRAYAIDGISNGNQGIGGTFFTLKHFVRNVTPLFNSVYLRFDLMVQKGLVREVSMRMINNNELIIKQIGDMKQQKKWVDLDQEVVSELLVETFELAELSRSVPSEGPAPLVGLLLGVAPHVTHRLTPLPSRSSTLGSIRQATTPAASRCTALFIMCDFGL
jgi:hypothetical protein